MYADDLHLPQIPSADACRAAGIEQVTLKSWISRKPSAVLLSDAERAEAGERTRFLFTLNRVNQIALTAEGVGLGLGPRAAALIAASFTDGTSGITDTGAPVSRGLGELFPTGQTLLVAYPGGQVGYVLNATADTPWHRALSAMGLTPAACTLLNVNQVVWRVRSALELPVIVQPGAF
jgi:hypothetical protein